jgi:hypothetical protein
VAEDAAAYFREDGRLKMVSVPRLLVVLLLVSCAAQRIYACQCREKSPPCSQYWSSDAVFVGEVSKIVPFDDPQSIEKSLSLHIGFERVTFRVDRVYRGNEVNTIELYDWMSSCRFGFKLGKKYLVYAYRNEDGILSTNTCSRTTEFSNSLPDLAYLAEVGTRPPQQEIIGILADHSKSLAGIQVMAESANREYRAFSERDGWFKLQLDEAGKYKVRILLPLDVGITGTDDLFSKISRIENTKENQIVEYDLEVKSNRCAFIDVPLFIPNKE